jgi:PHD/YefM family antitoxin component YafN of YafNO toxin-antitoxin module
MSERLRRLLDETVEAAEEARNPNERERLRDAAARIAEALTISEGWTDGEDDRWLSPH